MGHVKSRRLVVAENKSKEEKRESESSYTRGDDLAQFQSYTSDADASDGDKVSGVLCQNHDVLC